MARFSSHVLVLIAFAMSVPSFAWGEEADNCMQVLGKIIARFAPEGCQSPVGICTEGKIIGGGPYLDGQTKYTALAISPAAGETDPASGVISYTGTLTIGTRFGKLTVQDLGVLDSVGQSFSELSRSITGTRHYENVTGKLYVIGESRPQGFAGQVRGVLCPKSAVVVPELQFPSLR